MATTLRTILFVLLFAFIIQIQFNLDADKTATRQLKNSLEIAIHDGGLALSSEALSEGKIIFDQEKAKKYIKQSLTDNLRLSSTDGFIYKPKENSFFKNNVKIEALEFIDDSVPRVYPFVYQNPSYKIIEKVDGPCIIAIITTESPRWFDGKATSIRQAAVYEYKK